MKIALTGMIAAGKSSVLAELSRLGWLVLSADKLVASIAASEEGMSFLLKSFGDRAPGKDELRWKFLADGGFRAAWEGFVHPRVNALWRAFLACNAKANVVVEIPLLYEKKLEGDFGKVVVCTCRPELALERWKSRGGPEEDYKRLLKLLNPLEQKIACADFLIENNSTLVALSDQVRKIHKQLVK